jgi:hypothetical protein
VRLPWVRAGLLLGLLFLIGPISDLANGSYSPARTTAIAASLAAFVAPRVCRINLSSDTNEVALQIENDGAPAHPGSSNGTGLTGLAERARRLDGALESGARPEGGFRLRLTVPLPS